MSWKEFKEALFGRQKSLTLRFSDPTQDRTLTLEWLEKDHFRLSDQPDQTYTYEGLSHAFPKHGVSEGAVAGAGAAALMDMDLMDGAVIGDFIDRHQHPDAKPVTLKFRSVSTGQEREVRIKLTKDQLEQVSNFLN